MPKIFILFIFVTFFHIIIVGTLPLLNDDPEETDSTEEFARLMQELEDKGSSEFEKTYTVASEKKSTQPPVLPKLLDELNEDFGRGLIRAARFMENLAFAVYPRLANETQPQTISSPLPFWLRV